MPPDRVHTANPSRAFNIAFIGWNPFQLLHALPVAKQLPGSCFVIEKRKHYLQEFKDSLFTETGIPVLIWHRSKIRELARLFDVIICQTPFSQIEHFSDCHIIMLQYGYAKEVHNYGNWRAFADLNLVYGPYAAEKIAPLSPVQIVGNPAMDRWHDPEFTTTCKHRLSSLLNPQKRTILYVPTWGPLSTYETFIKEVVNLKKEFNVLLKLHHNTDLLDKNRKGRFSDSDVHVFGANDQLIDLLPICDIVLSDYSGAIFDALYCGKPIVLLQDDIEKKVGNKINHESLEHAGRDQIGPVIQSPHDLRSTINDVVSGKIDYTERNKKLVNRLYLAGPGASQRAADAIVNFLENGAMRTDEEEWKRQDHIHQYLSRHGT